MRRYGGETGARSPVYRLPGRLRQMGRPNYNSVVATFCHNIAHGLPLTIRDPHAACDLAYVDDVVAEFLRRSRRLRRPTAGRGDARLTDHARGARGAHPSFRGHPRHADCSTCRTGCPRALPHLPLLPAAGAVRLRARCKYGDPRRPSPSS